MEKQKPFEVAYRNWRKAADKGYGEKDHSIAHLNKVDSRIRQLRARYEELLAAEKGK
jgi:hypothetical protein